MADNKRKFVVSLEIDSKTAEQQIKASGKNIEKILANIGNASDRITYFKGLVDEIANVDRQLSDFKSKFGDKMFNEMFGNFNIDIEGQLKETIGLTKQQLAQFDELYSKKSKIQQALDALDNKPIKIDTTTENDVEVIEKLIEEYKAATQKWSSTISDPKASTSDVNKIIAERVRLATLLTNTSDYVIDYGSDDGATLASINKTIDQAREYVETFHAKSQNVISGIKQDFNGFINDVNNDIKKVMAGPKDTSNVYDELYSKLKKYLYLQKQLEDENISDADYNIASDDIANIEEEIIALGELKGKAEDVQKVFDEFYNSKIADDNLFDEIRDTLGIEIPKQAQRTEAAFDQVGKHVIESTEYVKGLEAAIKNMFNEASKTSNIEYKILINGQEIDARGGIDGAVPLKTSAEAYLANLTKDIDIDAHSHQGKSANINIPDFKSAIDRYYGGLTKMSAIVSDKDILTLDLTKVKLEDAFKALGKVEEVMSKSKLKTISPEKFNQIFSSIDSSYTDIAKKWEPDKFGELAQYIYDVKQSSEVAITPLERFKNLLMTTTGGKIDLSKYTEEFNNFSIDNVEELFNKIMKLEGVMEDGKILQVDDKVTQGSIENITKDIQRQQDEFLELRQTAKLTYADIRAEIEKYMSTGDKSFFDKYYHKSDDIKLADYFTELADNYLDINSLTNKIAGDFGIEPKEIGSVEQMAAVHRENTDAMKEEADAKKQLVGIDDDDNTSDITRENGLLEEKLDLLREIADEYGVVIDNKKRNRYEELNQKDMDTGLTSKEEERFSDLSDEIAEADENLEQFGATYEKIMVKLANGKIKEILPDDKGLRDLYKYADSMSYDEFGGKEIADIEFIRKSGGVDDYLSTEIPSAVDKANTALEQAENKLNEFEDLVGRITSSSLYELDDNTDVAVGRYMQRVDDMKAALEELGKQGLLTSEQLERVGELYDNAQVDFNYHRNDYTGYGGSDYSYEYEYDEARRENEELKATNIVQATNKLKEFYDLTKKIESSSFDFTTDQELGNYRGQLELLNNELEELSNQSMITAEDMKKVASAYDEVNKKIQTALDNNQHRRHIEQENAEYDAKTVEILERKVDELQSDVNYYLNEYVDEKQRNDILQEQLEEKKLADDSKQKDESSSDEIAQLEKLEEKIKQVKEAVELKTQAFREEGDAVSSVVRQELDALDTLSKYLDTIRVTINDIVDGLDKINNTKLNRVQDRDSKVIVDDNNSTQSGTKDGWALNDTLLETNRILDRIIQAIRDNEDMPGLIAGLEGAVKELRDVSKGIIDRQRKQTDTLDSSKRIDTDEKRAYLSGIASQAVSNDINSVSIDKFYAAADGLVGISGAIKNSEGVWEGFSLHINEANEAVDVAIKKNSLYAKQLNETATATASATAETKVQSSTKNNITGIQDRYIALNARVRDISVNNSSVLYDKATQKAKEYTQALDKLKIAKQNLDKVSKGDAAYDGLRAEFVEAKSACQNLGNELKSLLDTYEKFKSSHDNVKNLKASDYNLGSLEGRKQALLDYIQETHGAAAKTRDFNQQCTELNFTLKNSDGSISNMTASFDKLKSSIGSAAAKANDAQGFFQGFLTGVTKETGKLLRYFTARVGIDEFFQQFRNGIQYVRDIDTALTELKKVTSETDAVYDRFLQTASKTAGIIGSTVSELTTMSAEWARLGYSIEESAKLAESTAILLNVSEFTDATQASEALISTMQAFGYAAEESQHVVDILNEVGNNYAISSDGIATALQDSASALMEGGNNLEQATALVAAANRVVQDPNSVGSALRTISLRLRGTSVEVLEEMGEATDGVVESTSKMQAKIKALSGVDIIDMNGAYKDTYTILNEIGKVWKDMNDIDQAALLELMAGKNRANTLAAILDNMKDLEGAYETAIKAEGSALRENEAYLNSIQGRIDLFTNALQTMWMNLIDSSAAKTAIDAATVLIKVLDTLPGKITAVVAAFAVYKKFTDGIKFKDMFTGFTNISGQVLSGIKSIITATQSLTGITLKQAISSNMSDRAKKLEIISTIGLAKVNGVLTQEQIKTATATLATAFANGELTASQYLAIMSSMGLKTALQGLWNVLKANPIVLVGAAVTAGAIALDAFHTTAQEAADATKEAFDEIKSVVESTESTIQSLESELDTINDRIDELSGKELSFAEDQELKKLEAQREELERSLQIQENILELQKKSQAEQAVASMKAYTKAASEGAAETQKTVKNWSTILGAAAAVAGVLLAPVTAGGSAVIAAGVIGGIAGNKIGEVAGSAITQNEGTYDSWYETYTKALETSRKEEQEALEKYQKDSSNIEKLDKWQEAQQKVADIETEMYNHMSQMQQYYNTLEYGVSDEIDKELDTWYNFLDKFAIEQGASGAEVSALDRIFGENASKEIKEIKKQIRDASRAGKDFDFSAAINGSEELKNSLEYVGLTAQDVEDYFTKLGEKAFVNKNVESFKSYSALSSQVESYNGVLSETSEYVADNVKITQEYKDSLTALGISEKELNECFYEGNPLIVKNAKELQRLVNTSRENVEANIDLAQSYSRLDYYELVQELGEICDVTEDLNAADIERANVIMNQIDLVQDQIYKYQLLKETLSETGQAYQNFKNAQEIDALNTSGDNFVEMAQTLYDAFNVTGEVGTQAFEAAVEALIPDDIYASLESDGDKLVAIYDYFNKKVLPSLTLDKSSDDSAEGTLSIDNIDVENFVEKGLKKGIFTGSAKDGLAAAIDSETNKILDYGKAAEKMGMSVIQFKAYLAELEKYDYNTSAESFLSQFDQSFDGQVSHVTSKMQELNEEKMRLLSSNGGYEANKDRIAEINKELETCSGDLKTLQAEAVASYEKFANNKQAIEGLETIEDKTRELTKKEANALGIEWDEVKGKTVQEAIDYLTEKKLKLTELTPIEIQFAQQGINEEIDNLIADIEKDKQIKLGVKIDDDTGEVKVDKDSKYVTKDVETGLYTVNIEGEQGEALEKALNTSESLSSYLDDGVVTTDEHLENIHTVLSEIYAEISGKESSTAKDAANKEENRTIKDSMSMNDAASISMDGINTLFTETIPQEWNEFWDSVGSFTDIIGVEAQELYHSAVAFFTETIPETWDSFWEEVGSFIDEFISDAQDLYNVVSDFFTNTLPKAWSDFWNEAYDFVTEDIAYAIGWAGKEIARFFTETMPEAWDDFWNTISNFFSETLPSALDNIDACIAEFFTQTVPKAWSDFWDTIGNFFGETLPAVLDVIGGYIGSFFTQTIPYHWNNFWSVISNFFTQTIPTALSTIGAHISNFFTVTIPYHWNNFWSTVGNFFTETIPSALTTIGTTISTFFTQTIPGYISNLFSNIGSSILSFITNFGANALQGWKDNNGKNNYGGGGTHGVNGTAHAKGTAHATGNWGLSTNEKDALVGELGQELVVDPHSGRYYTVGDTGAEMVNLPKGAIIFNHKQTEGLLKNGYVTSRGKAYANGNAHIEGPAHAMWSVSDKAPGSSSYKTTKSGKSTSSKKTSDYSADFEEVFDWFEIKIEEINEQLDLMGAKLENVVTIESKHNILNSMIKTNKEQLDALKKGKKLYEDYAYDLLLKIPKAYRDEAKNGQIAIEEFYGKVDEKTLEAIKNYREWAQKAADTKQQLEEVKRTIAELAKQKYDVITDKYDNITELQENRQQHYLDRAEYYDDKGWINSGEYYEAAIQEEKNKRESLENEKKKLQASLDESVKNGDIEKYSDEWYEMVNGIHEVDAAIDECNANIEEFQNNINEIHFENFEKGLYRISRIAEETQNIIDMMANKDVTITNDNGDVEWTDEGITQMGLYAQIMENARQQSELYAREIDHVNQMYEDGDISYQEYLEKLDELKDSQYEAIELYQDSKDAIIELQKARIDEIKNGIDEEIEAYEELIDKKREELDAEKDLYDFQRDVMDQTKDIADLQRKLAALSGDNSAAAMAKRRQLEAELAAAQQEQEDMFYERSIENKQTALDNQLEFFTETREAEKEMWDKYLEDTEQVFLDSMEIIKTSGTTVKDTLKEIATDWDLQINDHIKQPWNDASTAFETTAERLDAIIARFDELMEIADENAQTHINSQKEQNNDIVSEVEDKFKAGEKAYVKKGTQAYDANGNKSFEVGYNTSYTVVSTDNKTGMTKVKTSDGKIRYFKTSDLSETAFSNGSSGSSSSSSSGGKSYPYGKASTTTGNIQYGDTGNKVKAIQWALKELGYDIGKSGVDGSFGPATQAAVKRFQKNRGITQDGIVGSNTRKKFELMGYAVGSKKIKEDQLALIDELGEELVLHAGPNGRLEYLTKGSGVLTSDMTERLMNLAMNPQDMLDRNRPSVGVSPEVHNTEINLNIQYGDMLKIENFKGDNPEEIAKIVAKEFEKHTAQLNQSLRKYVR